MSHVKNVQAFEKLAGLCTGYGGAYNPRQQNLQVNALVTSLNNAQQVLMEVTESQTVLDNAINKRRRLFQGVKKLSSHIFSVLKASGADALTLSDARASVRKLWGQRSYKPPDVVKEGEVPKSSSVYGSDFASAEYYFSKLVETVSSVASYQPNEPKLTVAGLNQMLAELRSANEAVLQAEVQWIMARKKRNDLMYHHENSLHNVLRAAKSYVRGVFGYQSPEHVQVVRLRFNKPTA
jgi:hypothetical protein